MNSFLKLLEGNKNWAAKKINKDPNYFKALVGIQRPDFLWIGCSDSRMPADLVTGTQPGEIFVHRNIANLVVNTDVNLLAVLDYAVNFLNVKHVIVCGHYGCGGVKAAMEKTDLNQILNMWLSNIKDIQRIHFNELQNIKDETERYNRLVELNVLEQIKNLAKTSIIQKSWKQNNAPGLHGWVYSLHDGIIKPIIEMEPNSALNSYYEYNFE